MGRNTRRDKHGRKTKGDKDDSRTDGRMVVYGEEGVPDVKLGVGNDDLKEGEYSLVFGKVRYKARLVEGELKLVKSLPSPTKFSPEHTPSPEKPKSNTPELSILEKPTRLGSEGKECKVSVNHYPAQMRKKILYGYSVLVEPDVRENAYRNLLNLVLPSTPVVFKKDRTIILSERLPEIPFHSNIKSWGDEFSVFISDEHAVDCTEDIMLEVLRQMLVRESGYFRYQGLLLHPTEETIHKGIFQSVQKTESGTSLVLDSIACRPSYCQPRLVSDLVKDRFGIKKLRRLTQNEILKLNSDLVGVKVRVTHLRRPRTYRIKGFTSDACNDLKFEADIGRGKETLSVCKYFLEKHKKAVEPRVQALDLSRGGMDIYMPLEVCMIVENQPERLHERSSSSREKDFRVSGIQRMENINEERNAKCFSKAEPVFHEFGLVINEHLTEVSARRLAKPELKKKGEYNTSVRNWCVLNVSRHPSIAIDGFCREVVNRCRSKDMVFEREPAMTVFETTPDNKKEINQFFFDRCYTMQIHFLFVALPDDPRESTKIHKWIKRQCEHVLGYGSQCFKPMNHDLSGIRMRVLERLTNKINVKCGGRSKLLEHEVYGLNDSSGATMVLGADVTHFEDKSTPSVAAFVASIDSPGSAKYKALLSPQPAGVEIISNLYTPPSTDKEKAGGLMRDMLQAFQDENNGKLPDRIIFYRDGVGDSQFHELLNEEGRSIKDACASMRNDYYPKLTFVVVQKRHHTRFFSGETDSGNLQPGTVIDRVVTRDGFFDFFLCNGEDVKGNTRLQHYVVLYDDNAFTADQIQKITHCLCHLCCRSDTPVSLVSPAYYAHLAAARGREYLESYIEDNDLERPLTVRQVRKLISLKPNIAQTMFYA